MSFDGAVRGIQCTPRESINVADNVPSRKDAFSGMTTETDASNDQYVNGATMTNSQMFIVKEVNEVNSTSKTQLDPNEEFDQLRANFNLVPMQMNDSDGSFSPQSPHSLIPIRK